MNSGITLFWKARLRRAFCVTAHGLMVFSMATVVFPVRAQLPPVDAGQLREVNTDKSIPPADYGKWINGKIHQADHTTVSVQQWLRANPVSRKGKLQLVLDAGLRKALGDKIPSIYGVEMIDERSSATMDGLAAGDHLVWIGPGANLYRALNLRSYDCTSTALTITPSEQRSLFLPELNFKPSRVEGAYLKPHTDPKYPYSPRHNLDEELRGELIPLWEARDRYGRTVAWPAVHFSNEAPSLGPGRFDGSEFFLFLFENPTDALSPVEWQTVLNAIAEKFASGMQIRHLDTNYDSYQPGETILVRSTIGNHTNQSRRIAVDYLVQRPGEREFTLLRSVNRVVNAHSESDLSEEFKCGTEAGLWKLRLVLRQDQRAASMIGLAGTPDPLESRDGSFVVLTGPLKSKNIIATDGMGIVIDGKNNFWAGTHYYPGQMWFDGSWRDFHALKADEAFKAMRQYGYRAARIWLDPVHDELTLRAADAMIYLAAQYGIVLDVCVFTQWVRTMGYITSEGELVKFEFRPLADYNCYSVNFRNLNHQRNIMSLLGGRWKDAGNIFYDLSNETYVKDPTPDQMDPEAQQWDRELGMPTGTRRNAALFRKWGEFLEKAVRDAGGKQIVMPGYMFDFSRNRGGDTYEANVNTAFVPWHDYGSGQIKGDRMPFFDPLSTNRPLFLEEFGGISNSGEHYDSSVHYTFAAGGAMAMAYEWGISWLNRDFSGDTLPLYEYAIREDGSYDPRFFSEVIGEVNSFWDPLLTGIAGWTSGYWNSSIYDLTPFPMEAAIALGRLGMMGTDLGRIQREYTTYVVIPTSSIDAFDACAAAFHELRRAKVVFGVWQERDLERLPASAKLLLAPGGVKSAAAQAWLDGAGKRGIKVFNGADNGWKGDAGLETVETSGAEGLELFVRPTISGTSYCLFHQDGSGVERKQVGLKSGEHQVEMGWDDFGIVQFGPEGINFLEGTGQLTIDQQPFAEVTGTRALFSSIATGGKLSSAKTIQAMTIGEGRIRFERPISKVELYDDLSTEAVAELNSQAVNGSTITIDSETYKYRLVVHFANE